MRVRVCACTRLGMCVVGGRQESFQGNQPTKIFPISLFVAFVLPLVSSTPKRINNRVREEYTK